MSKEPITGKKAGWAFLAIGIAVIALAALVQKRNQDFYASAGVTQGVITKTELRDKNATNQKRRAYYSFEVAGAEYQSSDDLSSLALGELGVGDAVEVLYAPENPGRSELAADREGPPWIFYIVGAVCSLIGVMGIRRG